jgi:serine O-acetyltransferase
MGLKWLARFLSAFARWLTGIEIHPGARKSAAAFSSITAWAWSSARPRRSATIARLYQGVTLGGTSWNKGKRHPTLGNNVVIGAGAKVLGPFKVGDNARIGSNSVVIKEVPANATVVGVPGRVVEAGEVGSGRAPRNRPQVGFRRLRRHTRSARSRRRTPSIACWITFNPLDSHHPPTLPSATGC